MVGAGAKSATARAIGIHGGSEACHLAYDPRIIAGPVAPEYSLIAESDGCLHCPVRQGLQGKGPPSRLAVCRKQAAPATPHQGIRRSPVSRRAPPARAVPAPGFCPAVPARCGCIRCKRADSPNVSQGNVLPGTQLRDAQSAFAGERGRLRVGAGSRRRLRTHAFIEQQDRLVALLEETVRGVIQGEDF